MNIVKLETLNISNLDVDIFFHSIVTKLFIVILKATMSWSTLTVAF